MPVIKIKNRINAYQEPVNTDTNTVDSTAVNISIEPLVTNFSLNVTTIKNVRIVKRIIEIFTVKVIHFYKLSTKSGDFNHID